jgi:hypothetical protein
MTDPRHLYGLPIDSFVAERDALAKAIRAEGDRARAAEVAKLRKPSVAAWAVNQLVRTQRREVAELFEAGDQLQRAQSDLLAGRAEGQALREAAERERVAVEQLTATGRGLLSSQGHELSAAMLERVGETLHAAALDPDARAQVADGCLERELRHVGIGGPAPRRGVAERRSAKASAERRTSTRRQEAQREQDARFKAVRKAAEDARRAAKRAERELRAAQQRRDRAADALDQAEVELADARRRAEQATLDCKRAERALADATR